MGRERSRKMERLLLYIASSLTIFTIGLGCSYVSFVSIQKHPIEVLKKAAKIAEKGDIPGALQQNKMALTEYPTSISDQALFQRGILLSHPMNPKQNYKEAIRVFQQLLTDFPDSYLRFETEAWLKTFEQLFRQNRKISVLEQKLKAQLDITKNAKERHTAQDQHVEELVQQIEQLEEQIDKLKKVDLGIELEKRKTVSQ